MTCIIGMVQNNEVWIGADSAGSNGALIVNQRGEKIFKKGEYVIAYTSSFRMGQLLECVIDLPKAPEKPTKQFMVAEFVEVIRKNFKDYGFSEVNSNVETGGAFLVGVKNKLFHIQNDYQVKEVRNGNFSADGSGMYYAFGAMEVLQDHSPYERIKKALSAASKYNPYVSSPFKIMMVQP